MYSKLILTGCCCRISTIPGEELLVFIEPNSNLVTSGEETGKDTISETKNSYIGDRKQVLKSKELTALSQNESLKSDDSNIKGDSKNMVISFNSQADALHFKEILQDHIDYNRQMNSLTSRATNSFKLRYDSARVGEASDISKVDRRNVGVEEYSDLDGSEKGGIVDGLGLSSQEIDLETQAESLMPSVSSEGTASVITAPPSVIVPKQPPMEVPHLYKTWAKTREKNERGLYTRYFVIDKGTLSCYMEPSDEYPFGKTLQGNFFLSSYKVRLSNNRKEQDLIFIEFDVSEYL